MTVDSVSHRIGLRRFSSIVRLSAISLALVGAQARPAAATTTYYVDNSTAGCSNSGAGTEAQPYCTISAAVAAHKGPDVTIIVKPGIYREQVTIPASGAAGLPFIIRAQGPGVVVDGSDTFASPSLWTVASGPVWLASSATWAPLQVFADGARLTPSTATPGALPPNAFTWVSGQGLYVNLGGDNPGTHQTLVGHRNYGFSIFTKSWVTIEGFEIAHIESRGVYLQTGCSDLVIARNRVSFANSYGIQNVGGARILIDQNTVSDCNYHGIGLTAGATGCTVRGNESFRNADPAARRATGIYLNGAPANTLVANRLHDNQDSGVNFYSGSNDCVSYNNRSWNNGDHGFDHLDASGTTHSNDVASGNYKDGFSIEGNSPNSRLSNCIAVENGLTTDEFDLWVNDLSSVGLVSDYNLFWNSTTQVPFKFITTKYATLAEYQAASGQDAHSYQADARFVNGPGGDFHLRAGSPAIDAANSAAPGWPATDAAGSARLDDPASPNHGAGPVPYADLGAVEYVPTPDRAPVVISPATIKAAPNTTVTFTVTASDPDGDPIQSLTMLPVTMPANSGATFVPNATNTAGTFTWPIGKVKGNFTVQFRASNALTGTATTQFQVKSTGGKSLEATRDDEPVAELAFSGGFPNPSAGDVEFALDLPEAARVRWAVFDLAGRMVWSEERTLAAGRTRLRWDGMTRAGARAATGVYLVRAQVEDRQFSRRVVRF